jgi:hypothetical protein
MNHEVPASPRRPGLLTTLVVSLWFCLALGALLWQGWSSRAWDTFCTAPSNVSHVSSDEAIRRNLEAVPRIQ